MVVSTKVSDVMDQSVVRVDETASIYEAMRRMLVSGVWSVLIERQQLPVGVLTERDIIRRAVMKEFDLHKAPVGEIMSSPLITIGPEASIGEAMERMTQRNVRRLFVLENGKIIGRITQTEIFYNNLNVMLTLTRDVGRA